MVMRPRIKQVSLDTIRHSTPDVPPHMIHLRWSRTLLAAFHRNSTPLTVSVHMVWLFSRYSAMATSEAAAGDVRIGYYQFGQKKAEEEIREYSFRQSWLDRVIGTVNNGCVIKPIDPVCIISDFIKTYHGWISREMHRWEDHLQWRMIQMLVSTCCYLA